MHAGVAHPSSLRLREARDLEVALIGHMREAAPDLDRGDSSILHRRVAAQTLKDAGVPRALPDRLLRILRSISEDGRGDPRAQEGSGGSIDLRSVGSEAVAVTLRRSWKALEETAEIRRNAAGILLGHLLSRLPDGLRGTDLLVETTLGDLRGALADDLAMDAEQRDIPKLVIRALMWLHEQEVIRLNRGLAVFRPAMTVRLGPPGGAAARRGFARADFEPLALHYREQVLQIHVMAEFAARGLAAMADAVRLSMDYFSLERQAFLDRWLPEADTARQTTPETWRAIVEALSPAQRRIVVDDREQANVLVLAGPGSGKTRVLVHRIAYLVRVRREDPRGVLALAYNRHAAVEIRRRLGDMIGADARRVTVLTCHALAMRLVGASFAGTAARGSADGSQDDFAEVLRDAVSLLRGDGLPADEADVQRERLLAGFRWILVDEYQDIDRGQYELISTLAGRRLADEDSRLSLFAVGDDDQNIYAFAGASVEFIRRFTDDYRARPSWLVENYRSTACIIEAANAFIAPARQRMKSEHPIRVDADRAGGRPGGEWEVIDPVARGRVQLLPAGGDDATQAMAALAELRRLAALTGERWSWRRCAVIARHWDTLDPVRSLCEKEGIPAQVAREDVSYFWRLRETQRLLSWLEEVPAGLIDAARLEAWTGGVPENEWSRVLREAIAEFRLETGDAETSVEGFREWLAEWGRELRRRQTGLLLLTAHRAKGMEFDHVIVLDGEWRASGRHEDPDAWRRLFYVAMTRARKTLALARLARFGGGAPELRDQPAAAPIRELEGSRAVLSRGVSVLPDPPAEAYLRRQALSLGDVDLGFAGRLPASNRIHADIRGLGPGDGLVMRTDSAPWRVATAEGRTVGRLARTYEPLGPVREARVRAVVRWSQDASEPDYRDGLRCDAWEVVVPELVFEGSGGRS